MKESKDLKRCSCRECDFKSDDLVDHIEEEHGDLARYCKKHKLGESDIIFEELIEEKEEALGRAVASSMNAMETETPSPRKKARPASMEEKPERPHLVPTSFKILDQEMSFGNGTHNGAKVPKLDEHYYFGSKEGGKFNIHGERVNSFLQDINENKRVMLVGHTGTGKSTLIEQVAARTNQSCVRISCNGQITVGDMIGLWSIVGGDTVWIDGILTNAVRNGHWVILDEIDFSKEEILANLNALLEPDGELILKEKGFETLIPHPNFKLFATANTIGRMKKFRHLYQGTNEMNEAFLDRWRIYLIDYLPKEQEIELLAKKVPRVTKEISTVIVEVGNMIRAAFLKEELSTSFSTRKLLDWTELMVRFKDPEKAADVAIYSKIEDDAEIEAIRGIISRVMKTKPTK